MGLGDEGSSPERLQRRVDDLRWFPGGDLHSQTLGQNTLASLRLFLVRFLVTAMGKAA